MGVIGAIMVRYGRSQSLEEPEPGGTRAWRNQSRSQ